MTGTPLRGVNGIIGNKLDSLTAINIPTGKQILTIHVTEHGNMNFDYLEFTKQ